MVQSRPTLFIDDDTEDAPWMVMSDWQYAAVNIFFNSLKSFGSRLSPPLYVAAMLPIRYHPLPGDPRIQQLAPDVFVARIDPHYRSSYLLEEEGVVPAFVLEVVSPESRQRDTNAKRRVYEAMGVEEYLLFDPMGGLLTRRLQGYRREGTGFVAWELDDEGRLWSEVVGAWLVLVGEELRLQRPDGTLVPTQAEAEAAAREEALARERAEIIAREEALARERAEILAREEALARERAEAAAREEALAREQAEAATREEALAREQAEEEVRRLAEELARLRASLQPRDSDKG